MSCLVDNVLNDAQQKTMLMSLINTGLIHLSGL